MRLWIVSWRCKKKRREWDILENEVVGIAWWGSEDNNDTDQPMLEETSERRIERSVARPESRKGQNTLTAKFLNKSTLGEDDTEDVSKGRQGNKDGERALRGVAKDVAEERSGDETLGSENLLLGHGGEIGNVDEHVHDGDGADGQGRGNLEGALRVLGLAEGVVGVAVADITPDDVVQGRDDAIGAAGGALKGVGEVVGLLVDLEVAAQRHEAGNDDDEDDEQLDDAEGVLQTETPFQRTAMDEERGRDARQTNTALIPAIDLDIRRVQDKLAKDDRVSGRPAE